MKNLFMLATLVLGTSAMACPDLAGTYSCPGYDDNGAPIQVETTIAQSESAGVTYYSMNSPGSSWEMPADAKLYEFTFKDADTGNDFLIGTSLTCKGEVLDQFLSQKESDPAGKQVSAIEGTISLSKTANGNIARFSEWYMDGQAYSVDETCTKK